MADGPIDVSERVLPRPDWWHPGCAIPLPAITASKVYSGSGALNSGGKVWAQTQPVRWEAVAEWRARTSVAA